MVFLTQPAAVGMKISVSGFGKTLSWSARVVGEGEQAACWGVLSSPEKGNRLRFETLLAWIRVHSRT